MEQTGAPSKKGWMLGALLEVKQGFMQTFGGFNHGLLAFAVKWLGAAVTDIDQTDQLLVVGQGRQIKDTSCAEFEHLLGHGARRLLRLYLMAAGAA